MSETVTIDSDILVVGSGIAGLTFALRMAEIADVALVTKKARVDSNTNYAQGGIAAVLDADDSFASHVTDTIRVGAGLCHQERVEALVHRGPDAVRDLVEWGVQFTRSDGELALGVEGGHSRPRIVHSRDLTGPAIETALVEAVSGHPRIQLFEHHMALSLRVSGAGDKRRCAGGWALDEDMGRLLEVRAPCTLLATGGSAAIYLHTTNPPIATGDGVAMAHRAGAIVANMEFVQFHPTALYPAEDRAFLITEALRGAGAVLLNDRGEEFMRKHHARGSLAPRDVVARAVHAELIESGADSVWLDAMKVPAERLEEGFPNVLSECGERGIDPRRELIPVVPAAHYVCGGVWTGSHAQSTLPGLYAAGECACTGVHGANRLASNSLLEAVVFSESAAEQIAADDEGPAPDAASEALPPPQLSEVDISASNRIVDEIKQLMWDKLGIVRAHSQIAEGANQLDDLVERWQALVDSAGREGKKGDPLARVRAAEIRNMLEVARLTFRCAVWRRESRGLHYDIEHPYRDNERFLRDTFVSTDV